MKSSLFNKNGDTRREGIKEANRILTEAHETYFKTEEPQLRQQLLDAGYDRESIDDEINKIMQQLKLRMIEAFNKNLNEIVSEKTASHSLEKTNLPS